MVLEKVRFRPRARLVDIIGGDLIKDEMAGAIELVKNSFDADSKKVKISFRDLGDPDRASISIEDDGHGMTQDVLLEDWMSPATRAKVKTQTSPDGRPILGRKGIGRFSAMRLGDQLTLETKARGQTISHVLEVDWKDFRGSDDYLDEVFLEIREVTNVPESYHGTKLTIRGLKDNWDGRRIERLTRELRLLLSPVPVEHQKNFSIKLDLVKSGLDDPIQVRKPIPILPYQVPELADYIVKAHIEEDGKFRFQYKRLLYSETDKTGLKVVKDGKDVRRTFPDLREFPDFELPLASGPLEITFHMWDRDRQILMDKATHVSDLEGLGLRKIRRLLDQLSGVAIYRDGFRVRPYGDPNQDWLGLAQRRVQNPTLRLGPNQLFGLVVISSSGNPDLEDKSSREGVKENDAYHALRAAVLAVLSWMEPLRFEFRKRHRLGRPPIKSTRAIVQDRKAALLQLRDLVAEKVPDKAVRQRITRLTSNVEKLTDSEHERLDAQTEMMHDNHALGLLARFIVHMGRNLDSSLDSGLANIERSAKEGRVADAKRIVLRKANLELFVTGLASSREAELKIDELLDQLDPLTRPRKRRRSRVNVVEVARKARTILSPQFEKARVHLPDLEGEQFALAWEADVFHAVFNLLHNSLYWVQQVSGPRQITVTFDRLESEENGRGEKQYVELVVSDTGQGIPEASAESIFELSYSEKPDGTGIGLFVAREAVRRSQGSIELVNPGEAGARFRILLDGA